MPRIARRLTAFALHFLAVVFLMLLPAQAGWFNLNPPPDFSNHDVPLYEQISNHIKAKISSRLGEGKNTRDRYFIIPFAYENDGNDPEYSHSFMTVIRVLPDNKQVKLTWDPLESTCRHASLSIL